MSRTSEILQKAQSLRQKHQEDIDSELKNGIRLALNDTKNFVKQRANTILNDMQQEIEQTQQNLQDNLNHKKTTLQTNIDKMGQSVSEDTKKMQESLQLQLQSLKKDLQTLNALSQATADQAKLKKALFSSNIVLASIALILLITSISFAYISKSKYGEIQTSEARLQQIEAVTQQKTQDYTAVMTALYKARGGR